MAPKLPTRILISSLEAEIFKFKVTLWIKLDTPHSLTTAVKKISNIYRNETIWGEGKISIVLWLLSVW